MGSVCHVVLEIDVFFAHIGGRNFARKMKTMELLRLCDGRGQEGMQHMTVRDGGRGTGSGRRTYT